MFLLDSLLMAPGTAAFHLFTELARKAQDEWLDDDAVKRELQELYVLLEAGRISDREFEERECRLLERLEQIAKARFQDKWGETDATVDNAHPAEPATVSPILEAAAFETAVPQNDSPVIAPGALVRPPVDPGPSLAPLVVPPTVVPPAVAAVAETPARPVERPAPAPPLPAAPPVVQRATTSSAVTVLPPSPPGPRESALTVLQIIESTQQSLAMLKLKVSSVTSVARDDDGWRVTAELVERKGVPDTNDLLGFYEIRLDTAGAILRYERVRMRRRGDLNR